MTLPLRQTVLSAGLGLALAVAPTSPARGQGAADDFNRLQNAITALKRDVDDIKRRQDDVDRDVRGERDGAVVRTPGVSGRLSDLEARMRVIEAGLGRIEQKLGDMTRTSGASPVTPGGPPAPMPAAPLSGPRGTVRIANSYPTEVSVIVNRASYRVPPNDVREVDVPAGGFTYEVLMAGSRAVTSPIRDGETVTLNIH